MSDMHAHRSSRSGRSTSRPSRSGRSTSRPSSSGRSPARPSSSGRSPRIETRRRPRTRLPRRLASGAAALALALGGVIGFAAPAHAVGEPVGTYEELRAAFDAGTSEIEITAPITGDRSLYLAESASMRLDLAGQTLTLPTVGLRSGATLTILDSRGGGVLDAAGTRMISPATGWPGIDTSRGSGFVLESGTVIARGDQDGGAGIGGAGAGRTAPETDNSSITVSGGSLTAIGGIPGGAGIGGGANGGNGGTITITGGTVTAIGGGSSAAGIGGGTGGSGGTIEITGGTVTAASSEDGIGNGAGIGGGQGGGSGEITIGGTAVVDARSGADPASGGAGIGGGEGGAVDYIAFGAGSTTTVRAPHPDVSAIGPGLGLQDDGDAYGNIVFGAGSTVVLPADGGDQLMPAERWVPIAGTIVLDAVCTVAGELEIVDSGLVTGAGSLVQAGGTTQNRGVITLPTANIQPPGLSFVSIHNYGFVFIDVTPVGSERVYATSFTEGERSFPAGVWNTEEDGSGMTVDADTDLTGFADVTNLYQQQPAVLDVTASATSVDEGGSVELTATAATAGGRELGDVTAETVFTSDVPTDVVDGNRVAFPTASIHTVTGRYDTGAGILTDAVPIEVVAAPTPTPTPTPTPPAPGPVGNGALPATGADPLAPAALAALALLAGAALLRRRRTAR